MLGDQLQRNWEKKLGISLQEGEDVFDNIEQEQEYSGEHAFNTAEIREYCKTSLDALAAVAIPHVYNYPYPPVLLTAWSLLTDKVIIPRDESKIALGIPRGHGKTMLIKLFILWTILFTNKTFILITGSSKDRAEDIIADVAAMLNETNIINLFGDWKLGLEKDTLDLKKFGFRGRNIVIAGLGPGGSLRGMNINQQRPDLMIFDDIQTAEDADSQQISLQLEKWMLGTAMKAKSPHGCMFIFAGNMYPTPYSILKKLKTNPTWIKFISGAILADGTALWPEHRSLESLLNEFDGDIAAQHPEIFFSEVMNDTEAGTNNKVDFSLIKEWPWGENELPQGKFIVVDPATGKIGSDDTVMGYFEVYDGTAALKNLHSAQLSPGNTIRQALLMALRTGTRVIAVESTAYQSTLLYWFEKISEELGLSGFHFVEVGAGTTSKNSRIAAMLKTLTAGEIIVHDRVKNAVISQIKDWNPVKKQNVDGILDVLTYGPKVLEMYDYLIATDEDLDMQDANAAKVIEHNSVF